MCVSTLRRVQMAAFCAMLLHEVKRMDAEKLGTVLRRMRTEHSMTQAQLAALLHVSDKAVSKWKRGAGCPDASLIPAIARLFRLDAAQLMNGEWTANRQDGGNMRKLQIYQCPTCGNVVVCAMPAQITCCSRVLEPLQSRPANEAHQVSGSPCEDEWLLTFSHPMEKEHYLSFLLEVGFDRYTLLRLYPEGGNEVRMPRLPGGRFFACCKKDGLFAISVKK